MTAGVVASLHRPRGSRVQCSWSRVRSVASTSVFGHRHVHFFPSRWCFDRDDVRVLRQRRGREQLDQLARPVSESRSHDEIAPGECESVPHHLGDQEGRIDVASGEDRRHPVRSRPDSPPARRAAIDAAPAPSTTSFTRSRRSTIAWLISSSLTVTTSSRRSLTRGGEGELAGMLDGDAFGNRGSPVGLHAGERRARRCLYADDSGCPAGAHAERSRLRRRGRHRRPGRPRWPSSSICSASSSPSVPWPAITTGSSKAWTNVVPTARPARAKIAAAWLVERGARELDPRAVVPGCVHLRHRRSPPA